MENSCSAWASKKKKKKKRKIGKMLIFPNLNMKKSRNTTCRPIIFAYRAANNGWGLVITGNFLFHQPFFSIFTGKYIFFKSMLFKITLEISMWPFYTGKIDEALKKKVKHCGHIWCYCSCCWYIHNKNTSFLGLHPNPPSELS